MTKKAPKKASFQIVQESPETVRMDISGDLTHSSVGSIWHSGSDAVRFAKAKRLVINAEHVKCCDGTGVGYLAFLKTVAAKKGLETEFINLSRDHEDLLDKFSGIKETKLTRVRKPGLIESIGKITADIASDFADQVAFFANTTLTGLWLLAHPKRFRTGDFLYAVELAGFQAVGIVSLLGFLFGLIMAFSSAMPLRQFGVEIYVSDLVAIALVRVLGPFITAIVVTGRTGSAYAAEIGTMKINDEINALRVMNLEPVSFLAIPRILATVIAMPLLTIFANLFGLIGSGLVITSIGYSSTTYLDHIQGILTPTDVLVGLVKSLVYGGLIGLVGCLRGLQTKTGAGAVGISTTRAVVTAIILIVISEGIFSVILNILDI